MCKAVESLINWFNTTHSDLEATYHLARTSNGGFEESYWEI